MSRQRKILIAAGLVVAALVAWFIYEWQAADLARQRALEEIMREQRQETARPPPPARPAPAQPMDAPAQPMEQPPEPPQRKRQ